MSEATRTDGSPTVVLVHGAFADASSWNGVIERLQAKGVAVGHSYGGAVISNAAAKEENVVGLVYVAAFASEEGERLGEAAAGNRV